MVGRGGGGWKRVALDGKKERFVRIIGFLHIKRRFLQTVKSCSNKRCFGCENERLLRAVRKLSVNGKLLFCGKGLFFQLMQSYPIKKNLFSAHNDTDFALHQN